MDRKNKLPDTFADKIGELLMQLSSMPTWTQEKRELFSQIERLTERAKYKSFTGDCRDYHIQRKGESCLYRVAEEQRGALSEFAGKLVRLICCGGWDSYSGRRYLVATVKEQNAPFVALKDQVPSPIKSTTLEKTLANCPVLYKGQRMVVLDNSSRQLDEDYDVIVWDRNLGCAVGFCQQEKSGAFTGWVQHGSQELTISGSSAKEIAQATTRLVNWSLEH